MTDQNEQPKDSKGRQLIKLIYKTNPFSKQSISRRDFLKMAAAALGASTAVPLLSACDTEPEPTSVATAAPTDTPEPPPEVTIINPGVVLLALPGAYDNVVKYNNKDVTLEEGQSVVVISRDQTDKWYKVKTKEGREGWVEQSQTRVTPGFEASMRVVPISHERPVVPTAPRNDPPSGGSHYWYPN